MGHGFLYPGVRLAGVLPDVRQGIRLGGSRQIVRDDRRHRILEEEICRRMCMYLRCQVLQRHSRCGCVLGYMLGVRQPCRVLGRQQVRNAEPSVKGDLGWPDAETMASLPEMRRGHIGAALVKVVGRIERPGSPLWGYRSPQAAFAAAQAPLA